MKNLSIQVFIMAAVTAIAGFVTVTPAKAQAAIVVQIGNQAPPQHDQR